jgi:glycosyltransferase involved in cell wall biosynthesis
MEKPKVSVIIPTYNRRSFIRDALNSVYGQTFRDFEIILVDDGSTDGTDVEIKDYFRNSKAVMHKTDSWVSEYIGSSKLEETPIEKEKLTYFRFEKNGGIPRALNKGYELAKGDFVCQLSSDDIWMYDKLERQVSILEDMLNYDVGIVYSDYFFKDLDEDKTWLSEGYRWKDKRDLFHRLITDCCMNACTFLMRKEFYKDIGEYSLRPELEWNQDLHMNFRSVFSNWRIIQMKEPTACITIHSKQASKQGKCGLGNSVLLPEMIEEGKKRGWI